MMWDNEIGSFARTTWSMKVDLEFWFETVMFHIELKPSQMFFISRDMTWKILAPLEKKEGRGYRPE
jgi:hypothetical protein